MLDRSPNLSKLAPAERFQCSISHQNKRMRFSKRHGLDISHWQLLRKIQTEPHFIFLQ